MKTICKRFCKLNLVIISSLVSYLFLPLQPIYAGELIKGPDLGYTGTPWDDLSAHLLEIIKWILIFTVIIGLFAVVIGGYFYITSSGDPAKAAQGKNAVIGAVVGIIIAFSAYSIVSLVRSLF
ncbi:hypothetical protein ACFL14_00205 [Patescibacteria group bacterium]